MFDSLLLFTSSFFVVFLLGFQSNLVRDKHVYASFFTSLLIGLSQVASFKLIPNANSIETFFWILGGSCGIVVSIKAHDIWLKFYPNGKTYASAVNKH